MEPPCRLAQVAPWRASGCPGAPGRAVGAREARETAGLMDPRLRAQGMGALAGAAAGEAERATTR